MASEDVIELGSSDEEAAPASKKIRPGPNAMVHIPGRFVGVTIKPTKSTAPPQGVSGKATTTITKVNSVLVNPFAANKKKPIGKTILKTAIKPIHNSTIEPIFKGQIQKPIPIPNAKSTFNPVNLIKKLSNSQIRINKIPTTTRFLNTPIKIHSPRTINNLPPSITIKKTTVAASKRSATNTITNVRKKQKQNPKGQVGEVLTVELDDDDVPETSTSNPQWYLRPEDQSKETDLEKSNNEETEPSNFVEITIEDSPVKAIHNKQTYQVGTELSITIEDSPVKLAVDKGAASAGSDNETDIPNKVPHSKKKLEYPEDTMVELNKTIEIEIEPMDVENSENISTIIDKVDNTVVSEVQVEKRDSPSSKTSTPLSSKPKKEKKAKNETGMQVSQENCEFHPVYQSFIDLCFKLENSDDMKKIVEKKIKAYYKQVPKEYTESEEFIDMVSSKILSMKAGPEKMYLFIKDIVDELNLQRKMKKSGNFNEKNISTESEKFVFGDDTEFDSKRQRQIRKLEKTLKKLHRAIQKLEEQEVDFDDDEDSVYLLTESENGSSSCKEVDNKLPQKDGNELLQRYKERMVRVHAKFCQLTNTKMPSEPRVHIDARPGQPSGPAKRLEKWINKKIPIGTPLPFPDFHDVLRCVREANEEDKLGWNEADIIEEARDLFVRCGKKLQRRRQENEWRLAASRISLDLDPAEESDTLKKKLEENRQLATKKETDVFNKYADRQSQLKLEAEEIEDKEAEESPVESEDDEVVEEKTTLENKEKRKERLKRLIQEKSKKTLDRVNALEQVRTSQSDETTSKDTKEDENEKNDVKIDLVIEIDDKDENKNEPKKSEKVHSISDNSDKVDSDVDELHLLQKLYSANQSGMSSNNSSDTDTPIDISDTLQSGSDNKGKQTSDVISIENSSYSESETNNGTNYSKNNKTGNTVTIQSPPKIIETYEEIDNLSSAGVKKKMVKTTNDEYNDALENILLASSDDEVVEKELKNLGSDDVSMNLKDDAISIGDTVVQCAEEKSPIGNFKGMSMLVPEIMHETEKSNKEENQGRDDVSATRKNDPISIGDGLEQDIKTFINENDEEISNIKGHKDGSNVNIVNSTGNLDLDSSKNGNKVEVFMINAKGISGYVSDLSYESEKLNKEQIRDSNNLSMNSKDNALSAGDAIRQNSVYKIINKVNDAAASDTQDHNETKMNSLNPVEQLHSDLSKGENNENVSSLGLDKQTNTETEIQYEPDRSNNVEDKKSQPEDTEHDVLENPINPKIIDSKESNKGIEHKINSIESIIHESTDKTTSLIDASDDIRKENEEQRKSCPLESFDCVLDDLQADLVQSNEIAATSLNIATSL